MMFFCFGTLLFSLSLASLLSREPSYATVFSPGRATISLQTALPFFYYFSFPSPLFFFFYDPLPLHKKCFPLLLSPVPCHFSFYSLFMPPLPNPFYCVRLFLFPFPSLALADRCSPLAGSCGITSLEPSWSLLWNNSFLPFSLFFFSPSPPSPNALGLFPSGAIISPPYKRTPNHPFFQNLIFLNVSFPLQFPLRKIEDVAA